jgi:outer membrane receptor protein involved in Fe transport
VLRDPEDFSEDSELFRTFFNNPNEATLVGIELEARKSLGFMREVPHLQWLGLQRMTFLDSEFMEFIDVGGNFTWIDAEVDRTEAELIRSEPFYPAGSRVTQNGSRRLFAQPEWIANADISFDHPDWGTRATLALYAISDVLDAAGAAHINRAGEIDAITLDRYIDSFHTLDLVVKQTIWEGLAIKFQARNLTNSRRQIVYDPGETNDTFEERSYKVGRDFSLELSYTFYELPTLFPD